MYKVYEMKKEEKLNDRYYKTYETALNNYEYRLSEMQNSKYFLHVDKVEKEEIISRYQDTVKELSHIYSKHEDGSISMTMLVLEKEGE